MAKMFEDKTGTSKGKKYLEIATLKSDEQDW